MLIKDRLLVYDMMGGDGVVLDFMICLVNINLGLQAIHSLIHIVLPLTRWLTLNNWVNLPYSFYW